MTKSKSHLFISHAADDGPAARLLLEWLNDNLKLHVEINIFCSSHDLAPGTPWYDQITKELKQCRIGILLATPNSIHRGWVLFEAGALAGHGKPHIPVCAGGLKKSQLVSPLNELQAIEYSDPAGRRLLLEAIARELGVPDRTIANFIHGSQPPDLDAVIGKPSTPPLSPVPEKAKAGSDSIGALLRGVVQEP